MCTRNISTIIVVAILALAVGQVQAATIDVPNGTFHMYKPGTNYTVRGTAPDDIWVVGMGDNRNLSSTTPVPFDDGTSGLVVDIPGWTTPIESQGSPTNTCDLFSLGYDDTDGSSCSNSFGAWSGGNGTLAESADSLGNVVGGTTYTVSAMINGNGGPFTLELRAGGVAMTPSSSVNPISSTSGTSGWEVISTTYIADIAFVGQPMTIVVGTKRPGEGEDPLYGQRSRLDNVTLTASKNYVATSPVPADGSRTPPSGPEGDGYYMLMTFTAGYGATTHTTYFSSNFNEVNDRNPAVSLGSPPYPGVFPTGYYVGLDDPALPVFARTPLERGVTYYWAVDESNDTATYPGDVWSYTIASDAAGSPTPADGEEFVIGDPSLTLSWQLGDITNSDDYSISYDVYWGADQAAVEAGTSDTINVSDPTHIIGPLSGETDYYWKVDTRLTNTVPPFETTIVDGAVWHFTTAPPGVGHILREVWTGIPGNAVSALTSDPRYPDNPDTSELLPLFEGPTDAADEYGSRLHGWLVVSQTGDYTFWIATDDNGELWLSTDANPANAVLISWVGDFAGGGWAGPRAFDDGDVTPSGLIHLEGGREYYIAGLMKEGTGGDNIAVAWQGPDSDDIREVIPGYHLKPYVPVTAKNPDPAHDSVDAALDVTLTWDAGIDGSTDSYYATQHIYLGSDPVAVANATTASPEYMAVVTGPNQYGPLSLAHYEQVYWRVDGVLASSGTVEHQGFVWTFRTIIDPAWASNPDPADGAVGVDGNATLSWTPGAGATAHTIYLGPDDPGNMVLVAGPQGASSYTPPALTLGTTYYWRVVESPGMGEGITWSFTTSQYLVVDDMESYTPWTMPGNNIFEAWRDGMGNCDPGNGNGTGANLTENIDPLYVWGGFQSMKYDYDNDGMVFNPCTTMQEARPYKYSKIEVQVATLASGIGTDWTAGGVKALSINFMGQAGNATTEQFWVQLQDSSKTYGDKVFYGDYEGEDLAHFNEASWHEWNIDLADFNVDLANVVSIVIGIGNEDGSGAQGSGTLFLDDIRLNVPKCVPARRSADFAIVDYGQDCVVDYKEIEVMAANWLAVAGTVPNGDFELLYKPGTAITGNVSQWTQGVGPDCPIDTGEYVFSDATTGTVADIPGWIGADRQGWIDNGGTYERDQTTGNLQGSIADQDNYTPDGSQCYLANGSDFGNPAGGLIVSDAPLGNVEDGIYTLSMMANGDATPVVLELLADGVILTPTSSVDPVLSSEWQEFSRTYDSGSLVGFLGEPLTIRLGVGREASGGQTRFDDVRLFHSEAEKINFKDFAELAVWWLDGQLWPLP